MAERQETPSNTGNNFNIFQRNSRNSRIAYRYGSFAICFGVLCNWLGFDEPTLKPFRYIGLGCLLVGTLLICILMCQTLHEHSSFSRRQNQENVSYEVPSFQGVRNNNTNCKPPDYSTVLIPECAPPSYDEAVKHIVVPIPTNDGPESASHPAPLLRDNEAGSHQQTIHDSERCSESTKAVPGCSQTEFSTDGNSRTVCPSQCTQTSTSLSCIISEIKNQESNVSPKE